MFPAAGEPFALRHGGDGEGGAEGVPRGPLSVAAAVRRAVRRAPEVAVALAEIRLAAAEARVARALPNPLLTLSVRLAEAGARPGFDLGIAEDLHALLVRADRADAADARLRAAVERCAGTALDVAAEAATLAVEARRTAERAALLSRRAGALLGLREVLEARARAGEGNPAEEAALDGEIAAARVAAVSGEGEARAARIALALRLGMAPDLLPVAIAPLPHPAVDRSPAGWVELALSSRPEIRTLEREREAAVAEARAEGVAVRDGFAAGLEADGTETWEAGPAMSFALPLFDDGAPRREAAAARVRVLDRRLEAERRRAEGETLAAAHALAAAREALAAAERDLVPSVERRARAAASATAAGEADAAGDLAAERDRIDAELVLVDLRAGTAAALVRLHRAVGGGETREPGGATAPPTTEGGLSHDPR